jgi:DNA-binding Lrp family transcriptional regulator
MPSKTSRAPLLLTDEESRSLRELTQSRTAPVREVERARILLAYARGEPLRWIAKAVGVAPDTVYKCVDKALAMGAAAGLRDLYHRPKEPEITDDAKAWVVHIACTKPKDLGYASELWTRSALAKHVREHAVEVGFPTLARAAKATVHRILAERTLHPEKIRYYLEKRDPEFERKMKEVLLVYREVQFQESDRANEKTLVTVCLDEKPGVQAIANTAPDLPPVPDRHPTVGRDHEYRRMGTVSILAALDLHDGHIVARVEDSHRSAEFVLLLKDLDAYYSPDLTIRIVLDNHSAHSSKETRQYLATRPGRFVYVHTPTHGSWLNLAENLFGKMARTFLRHIRVGSVDELKRRILLGIEEMNAQPAIFRWTKFATLEADQEASMIS